MSLRFNAAFFIAFIPLSSCNSFANTTGELDRFYFVAGAGVNEYLILPKNSEQKNINAWEASLGAQLTPYFAAEIGYKNLGNGGYNFVSGEGVTLSLLANVPISEDFKLLAELGAIDQFLSDHEPGTTSPYAGAGLSYHFTKNLSFQALYRRYFDLSAQVNVQDNFDSNYYGIRLKYQFSSEPEPKIEPRQLIPTPPVVKTKKVSPDSDNDGVSDYRDLCEDTPLNYKVDIDGCTEYEKTISQINIEAKFGFNSAQIDPNFLKDIAKLANFMFKNPNSVVEIQGHASLIGNADYNLKLSEQRAASVAKVLSDRFGIDSKRISAKGYGESKPLIANTTDEANKVNRRIEAEVTVIHDTPMRRQKL